MYLIVTRSFPPQVGGMQNLIWGLCKSLSKYFMIKVYADYQENTDIFDDRVSFSIQRVKGIKIFRKYRKAFLINEYLKKNKKVTGIIGDHWKSLELLKSNKKKICLIHSKEINHKKNSLLNKRVIKVLNKCEHVIANSEFTKNLAIEVGVNPDLIKVINPGIEPENMPENNLLIKAENYFKNKTPRLITVSRYDKRKNHEKVIMSLRNLKQNYPNIIYISIGYGEEEENLKKLVKELDLSEQVVFLKEISQDLKNALISKSDFFVMPSIIHKKSVEGFGISYIEAAQFGVPSIGGKDGGASDAIIHEKTGLICDGNSLDSIYNSINKMITDDKFKEYGLNAKENSKKFHWDKIIENYRGIL